MTRFRRFQLRSAAHCHFGDQPVVGAIDGICHGWGSSGGVRCDAVGTRATSGALPRAGLGLAASPQQSAGLGRLAISSLVNSRFEGTVDEFVFRIESRRQELQVADYWPKTEMFSSTHGLVQVAQQENSREHAAIRGAAGYPGVGWVDGQASYDARADVQRVFQEFPEMQ